MPRPKPYLLVCSNVRLFASFFTPEHQARLSRLAEWKRFSPKTVTPAMRRELARADALITTWDSPTFGEDLPSLAPRLRMVGHCGGTVKGRFPRSLFDRLVITNAPAPMARHVAELAVAFLLYFARDIDCYRELLRGTSNDIYEEMHLSGGGLQTILGREVGLIGFGRIGRAIAELLAPFGTRLRVYDPYVPPDSANSPLVRFDSLEAALAASPYLIVAAGLTEETRRMLDRKRLSRMPKGAVLINVARGGLVDLDALTQMVLKGRLRCALDVTDPLEPLPGRHPLRRAAGAVLTPHVGAISRAVRYAISDIVLSDLERFFAGGEVENRVSPDMLDRMT